jgi:UDP-N-acetylglucosamine acyltransferase
LKIHSTAIVDVRAVLGDDVEIGPYAVVGADVTIGDRTVIGSHAIVSGLTKIGNDCQIHPHAVLGEPPQDKKYHGEKSGVIIGNNNIFREFVTVHAAVGECNMTVIGDNNMLMAYSHIGHNCKIGNNIYITNYVGISGGCQVDDRVVLGGLAGIHQNVHIGRLAMVGGLSKITHDVPPFVIAEGNPMRLIGLNSVGLRRNNISSKTRNELKEIFKLLVNRGNLSRLIAEAKEKPNDFPEVQEFIDFLELSGRSGRHLEQKSMVSSC